MPLLRALWNWGGRLSMMMTTLGANPWPSASRTVAEADERSRLAFGEIPTVHPVSQAHVTRRCLVVPRESERAIALLMRVAPRCLAMELLVEYGLTMRRQLPMALEFECFGSMSLVIAAEKVIAPLLLPVVSPRHLVAG